VVRFESPEQGGVKLVKTYTLKRGSYDIAVKHDVVNTGSRAVSPQLYLQLVRDGNKPPGESSFYSTFTGPAVYTDAKKYQKVEFSDIEKARPTFQGFAQRLRGHGAALLCQSAWLLADGVQRENFVRKVDTNLYAVGMITPSAHRAGRHQDHRRAPVRRPAGRKGAGKLAPGLELVKDYGWLTILAKPLYWLLDQLHGFWATGAGPSWRWWCCSRSRSTGSTPRPTPAWPR
jgi:YidC/Oxa1 family membrane protein insertase